jgi:hypothetical protein
LYAQARFQVADHLQRRHEIADHRGDHRRAAHAPADVEPAADLARLVLHDLDADVVQLHRRAIGVGPDDRDLELARQVIEFRMERRPLAQQFGIGARVFHLVGGGAGELVGGGVADAVAAGLDRVHFHAGKVRQDVGRVFQLDPVVLDVLARGEVAIAAVVLVGDIAQHPHLRGIERAIGIATRSM